LSVSALYLEHREALAFTIYRIVGCQQTAEDITQEAYLRLLQAQSVVHPKPYLFQIGRNLAFDHLRKQRIRQPADAYKEGEEPELSIDILPTLLPSPDQQVSVQQELALMFAALNGMPDRRREVLVLHKYHHWDYARIGKHFGISVSAVEKHIYRAMTQLLITRESK
jgi:RNA polymerase sigma factor (sigma-70 family)